MFSKPTNWLLLVSASVLFRSLQDASAQIPVACTDDTSLRNMMCCPDNCGVAQGRGRCVTLDLPNHSTTSTNVRDNWPHYYTRACQCSGNYAGFDCSACQYGYYGDNCEQKITLPRKSVNDREFDWDDYHRILQRARTYIAPYVVVLNEMRPGTTVSDGLIISNVTLYNLFVWLHHYVAKNNEDDNESTKADYAHEATGFLTWHRQFLLWFEWEVQQMLKADGRGDYYRFRTSYWDWRKESLQRELTIFHENRLGSHDSGGNGQVNGRLYGDDIGWNTTCWHANTKNNHFFENPIEPNETCNPQINTLSFRRCPKSTDSSTNRCDADNPDWPDREDVNRAIRNNIFDVSPFDRTAPATSFRNYLEGFDVSLGATECDMDRQCNCATQDGTCTGENGVVTLKRRHHNVVHIIVGIGDLMDGPNLRNPGVMADVAASPNDPLFINHHTMIDCILEEWLQRNPNAEYPTAGSINRGHRADDYVVPFFPVVKQKDLLKTADNFAYSCSLNNIDVPLPNPNPNPNPRNIGSKLISFNWMVLFAFNVVVGLMTGVVKL